MDEKPGPNEKWTRMLYQCLEGGSEENLWTVQR